MCVSTCQAPSVWTFPIGQGGFIAQQPFPAAVTGLQLSYCTALPKGVILTLLVPFLEKDPAAILAYPYSQLTGMCLFQTIFGKVEVEGLLDKLQPVLTNRFSQDAIMPSVPLNMFPSFPKRHVEERQACSNRGPSVCDAPLGCHSAPHRGDVRAGGVDGVHARDDHPAHHASDVPGRRPRQNVPHHRLWLFLLQAASRGQGLFLYPTLPTMEIQ